MTFIRVVLIDEVNALVVIQLGTHVLINIPAELRSVVLYTLPLGELIKQLGFAV